MFGVSFNNIKYWLIFIQIGIFDFTTTISVYMCSQSSNVVIIEPILVCPTIKANFIQTFFGNIINIVSLFLLEFRLFDIRRCCSDSRF